MRVCFGLAVIAIVAAALIPGGHSDKNQPFSVAAVARHAEPRQPAAPAHHQGGRDRHPGQEVRCRGRRPGEPGRQHPRTDRRGSDPTAAAAFAIPVARFRVYAERWAVQLGRRPPGAARRPVDGSRPAAKRAWDVAWSDYLHLGAVYGLLPGPLDRRMDGMPETVSRHAHFTGLHRIEMGLWTGAAPQSLAQVGRDARSAMTSRCGTCCPGSRSIRSTTLPARTRSWRTRSGTSSAASTSRGAAPACSVLRPGSLPPMN